MLQFEDAVSLSSVPNRGSFTQSCKTVAFILSLTLVGHPAMVLHYFSTKMSKIHVPGEAFDH